MIRLPDPDENPWAYLSGTLVPYIRRLAYAIETQSQPEVKKGETDTLIDELKGRIETLNLTLKDQEDVIERQNMHIGRLQEENQELRTGNPVHYHIDYTPDGDN